MQVPLYGKNKNKSDNGFAFDKGKSNFFPAEEDEFNFDEEIP